MKQLTKQQFLDSTSINPELINAVVSKGFGDWKSFKESAQDAAQYGCQSGIVFGFIYHSDTVAFAEKYFELIVKEIQRYFTEMYDDHDVSVIQSIAQLNNVRYNMTVSDIEDCLILRNKDNEWYTQVYNWLCWYACEVVCQEYVSLCESGE